MNSGSPTPDPLDWWNALRHGGMLVDPTRLTKLISDPPPAISSFETDRLRRHIVSFEQDENAGRGKFVSYVLDSICGFARAGTWDRGTSVDPARWTRRTIAGDNVKPSHLWRGPSEAILPVFIDAGKRVGVGQGKRAVTTAIQWLRGGDEKLAVVTNGRQWRLVMAGLDYEAFCEWDIDRWLESGETSAELFGLRALLHPPIWTPPASKDQAGEDGQTLPSPLVAAIADSRKGQADLSAVLGERVRQAVEVLIQAHSPLLDQLAGQSETAPTNSEIYRAGVRLVMRLVVGLFAESREGLLPKDNPIFHECYSLSGLRDQLERISPARRASSYSAYPRIISLFRLIHEGSSHEALVVPSYGGSLFAPGQSNSSDGVSQALHVLEQGCYEHEIISDAKVYSILDLLSRTKVKIRQGRGGTWVPSPVDFSSLDSEYIGILYEGLLDFELRVAGDDGPVIFLAVGNQPALPLSTLEAMDDKSLKNLLEKMKDTSSGDDEEDASDEDAADDDSSESDSEDGDEDDADDETSEDTDEESADDIRHTARTAAEAWAKRAIEVGKLVRPPRGQRTPEKQLAHQSAIDRKAKQIITKVVLPGERYLVRWGGTRKGSGTFYTRPQLAIPTVHRTLRPLAYEKPLPLGGVERSEGEGSRATPPDSPAPEAPSRTTASQRPTSPSFAGRGMEIPRRPEEILALKVCDPACGSGSFPLAALRFLTDALYHSLVYHDRFKGYDDRTVIDLIRDTDSETTLADETLPCRPDDAEFEPRTKAVLRRYIVERCIYGVDLDPLAVELCRLSLWIETLDRRLPFTFVDHKIKCGNSLIGTWFDQFMHYPAMAWMREGGDKSHTDGVHFKKEGWTKAIRAKVKDVKKDLIDYIDGAKLIYKVDLSSIETVHDEAEKALAEMHSLGIHQSTERAERYATLRGSESFKDLKFAFDLYCAMWYWPPEQIDDCPLPIDFYGNELTDEAKQIVNELSERHRFFHWEVEYPDVFNQKTLGFDAVLGNPPWETSQPNPAEYFSEYDPLFRGYVSAEKSAFKDEYFQDRINEYAWLDYCYTFNCFSNWVKFAANPFGNYVKSKAKGESEHDFNLGNRGKERFESSEGRHVKWRHKREELTGFCDSEHPFQHQKGRVFTYKLFLEQSHHLTREAGGMGLIVPSGLYSDAWSQPLRSLLLNHCDVEWLFGFENKDGIFDIHRSFKFNPIIARKGGVTREIKTAFMRRDVSDWENAQHIATLFPLAAIKSFSPRTESFLEILDAKELHALESLYSGCSTLGDSGEPGWDVTFNLEFMMNTEAKLFPLRSKWEKQGFLPDEYGRWLKASWEECEPFTNRTDLPPGTLLSSNGKERTSESMIERCEFKGKRTGEVFHAAGICLPLLQGIMVNQLLSNRARNGADGGSKWEIKDEFVEEVLPKYLIGDAVAANHAKNFPAEKLVYRAIARTTDTRTIICSPHFGLPVGNSLAVLQTLDDPISSWALSGILSSFVFDWQMRRRIAGTNVNWFYMQDAAIPDKCLVPTLALLSASLAFPTYRVSPTWLHLRRLFRLSDFSIKKQWAVTDLRRIEVMAMLQAIVASLYGIDFSQYQYMLQDCDLSVESMSRKSGQLNPVGFWRVDKQMPPELRLTVLSMAAFRDLGVLLTRHGGNKEVAIKQFVQQNDGEGWQLPETLRLADYGLGHDERAKQAQPVRECFGPRFYDWQLAQTPEESWAECHLHARNLLGQAAYEKLVAGDSGAVVGEEKENDQTPTTTHQPTDEPFLLTGEPKSSKKRK